MQTCASGERCLRQREKRKPAQWAGFSDSLIISFIVNDYYRWEIFPPKF